MFNINVLRQDEITAIYSQQDNVTQLQIHNFLEFAEPNFHDPAEIELLVGNGLFYQILPPRQIRLGK